MTRDRREYKKAWYEAHKEERKAKMKAWREANKDKVKSYNEAHKDDIKAYHKAYYQGHKESKKEYQKAYYEANIEQLKEYNKSYHKEYHKVDVNSLGQTKDSIRQKSRIYLSKYGKKIEGYQIHHCCTYSEPYKFIYCSKEMHRLIHAYLRQHNIDADSNHYELIKHLLDDTVVLYGLE